MLDQGERLGKNIVLIVAKCNVNIVQSNNNFYHSDSINSSKV